MVNAGQGHVVRHEITLANERVMRGLHRSQVMLDHREDQTPPLPTLRARSMIHHVLGDQVVDARLVTGRASIEQLTDDFPSRTPHSWIIAQHVAIGAPPRGLCCLVSSVREPREWEALAQRPR